MNCMVRALLPTPPPPTITSLCIVSVITPLLEKMAVRKSAQAVRFIKLLLSSAADSARLHQNGTNL